MALALKERLAALDAWWEGLPAWGRRLVWKVIAAGVLASCVYVRLSPVQAVCRELAVGLSQVAEAELDGGAR